MTFLLTRDRYEVDKLDISVPGFSKEEGYQPMTIKPLPSLSTGKGIQIGSSPPDLIRKLGRPSVINISGNHGQYRNYTYTCTTGKGDESTEYEETYTYKKGKLIEINFTWSHGGDEEDNAVVAPKAKRLKSDKTRH